MRPPDPAALPGSTRWKQPPASGAPRWPSRSSATTPGPAATITAQAGRQVQAHLARWSANPRIVIFWFTPSTSPGRAPHHLTAYNTAGHTLPAGNSAPGHG